MIGRRTPAKLFHTLVVEYCRRSLLQRRQDPAQDVAQDVGEGWKDVEGVAVEDAVARLRQRDSKMLSEG